jgi:hypothetical protein
MPVMMRSDLPDYIEKYTGKGSEMANKKLFGNYVPLTKSLIEEIYKKVDASDEGAYMLKRGGMMGIGPFRRLREGQGYTSDKPFGGRVGMVKFPSFGLAMRCTLESIRDDRKGTLVPDLIKMLKDSSYETKERYSMRLLKQAFVRVGYETDGVALCSRNHGTLRTFEGEAPSTLMGNRPSTDGAFSIAALDEMYISFTQRTNDAGYPQEALEPRYIIANTTMQPLIDGILGTARVVGSNNNDINLYYKKLTPIYTTRLDGLAKNFWFGLTEKQYRQAEWLTHDALDYNQETNLERRILSIRAHERYATMCWDWRWIYGNKGV